MGKICIKIGRQRWVSVVMIVVICTIFSGSVFGKNTTDINVADNLNSGNDRHVFISALDTETNGENHNGAVMSDGNGESATIGVEKENESSIIVKLGTFLLITSVLIFALQWHRKKKDR